MVWDDGKVILDTHTHRCIIRSFPITNTQSRLVNMHLCSRFVLSPDAADDLTISGINLLLLAARPAKQKYRFHPEHTRTHTHTHTHTHTYTHTHTPSLTLSLSHLHLQAHYLWLLLSHRTHSVIRFIG